MSALQRRNGSYRVIFRYHGKQLAFTIGDVSQKEAENKASQVDYLLMRLKQQLAVIPAGMDIVEYLRSDGKVSAEFVPIISSGLGLAAFRDQYVATHKLSLEANTLDGIQLHFKHLVGVLGEAFPIAGLTLADLQRYIDARANADGFHGRRIATATLKKEIITLRTAWNWGVRMKLVGGRFPNAGLRYPKATEKPPFQTRQEIERKIALGGLSRAEEIDLWNAMYLTVPEMTEMLKYVKAKAIQPWIYPLFCFLCHTGARRSEAIRAKVSDVDLLGNVVTINEKKRVKGTNSTRRVPLSPFLASVLTDWLAIHPGGRHLFCQQRTVGQSKKRGSTTVERIGPGTPPGNKERSARIAPSAEQASAPLTRNEFRDHFDRTLKDSDWGKRADGIKILRGPHTLRHSMISACASSGIDQRLIEEFVGHQSAEMARRYRHLYPSVKDRAIAQVFG